MRVNTLIRHLEQIKEDYGNVKVVCESACALWDVKQIKSPKTNKTGITIKIEVTQ